jgi:HD-GYP domain-containing protein (c-di-GMP phosphodiesterase class II)
VRVRDLGVERMPSTGVDHQDQVVSATGGSARSQADDLDERRWKPRRLVSFVVRTAAFAVPVLAAVVVVRLAASVVRRPTGSTAVAAWVVALTVVATVTVRVVDHLSHRLLPLEALLKLSLVFPDHAPSRFALALRSGSGRALERAVADARSVDGYPAPQEAAELMVSLIASVSRHDRLTRGHSERVRAYADLIGRQLRLDDESMIKLHWAALIHDVGKLDVPSEILTKKGRPTAHEWTILQGHPAASARYLGGLREWLGDWARAATEHHERIDGDGYPLGLRGDEISLAGRIVAVADAFDVMTSARSYKKPHPAGRARAELIENAGTQFDPEIVRAFLAVSLREVRLVVGPLAFLTQLPAVAQVPVEAAAAGIAPVVATVAAATIALAMPARAAVPVASRAARRPAARSVVAGATRTITPGRATRGGAVTHEPDAKAGVTGAKPPTGGAGSPAPPTTAAPATGAPLAPGPTPTAPPAAPPATGPASTAPPANHPPVAVNDTPSGKIHTQTVTVDVLANDHDPDNNLAPATLRIVRYPPTGKYASISVVDGEVQVTAPASYVGSTTFRYEICDTASACAQAEVTLTFQL